MDFKEFAEQQNIQIPKRKTRWIFYIIIALILLAILGAAFVHYATEYIWMSNLGFAQVFTKVIGTKAVLAVAGFLLFALVTYVTLFWIYRIYKRTFSKGELPPLFYSGKVMTLILGAISVIVGLFGSSIVQGVGWQRLLKFLNRTPFGVTDPYFHLDISFYMFVLPFLNFIIGVLIGLTIFMLVIEVFAYSVYSLYRNSRRAQLHLVITLSALGILIAANNVLAPFKTLLTNQVNAFQTSTIYGLSYTDKYVNIPKDYILAGIAILGIIWIIISLFRKSFRGMVTPVAVYICCAIAGQLVSVGVQQFIVSPNELQKEKTFIKHNIEYTQMAYDIDNVTVKKHKVNDSLTKAMLERNQATIDNIRIHDARPLLSVYNQLQTFRTYYEFLDVDVDRYMINGEYQQVFIGARELDTTHLPEQAKTWTNLNLRYTHGYGITMSHVNKMTAQGQPKYMVKNLPPQGVLDITQPQIYFGEESYNSVVVHSKVGEFDYPSGTTNVETTFKADTGIRMTPFNRLLFAINEGDFRLLISNQITSDSRLLQTRNIINRLNRIAPFFTYDEDPYIMVRDDGSLAWVVDTYVTAKQYPYAEPFSHNLSYIRNSIKTVIDAYSGEVTFYVAKPNEPIVQTYQKIFPSMFEEDIPKDIKQHFRYPMTLFKIQTAMYRAYHMDNVEIFYNREDYWEFPTEKYYSKDITMEPYYITMKLPGAKEPEFILMRPFTPKNRQNMIAWMGVRNDGEHYGEKVVYRFPKQRNVYGPQQIENRINQDENISKQLNLWSQGGSSVVRGNLLVIPIEDTVLYVEPLYLKSANSTALPEVKRIIVAYQDQIVMKDTLDQALHALLKRIGELPANTDNTQQNQKEPETSKPSSNQGQQQQTEPTDNNDKGSDTNKPTQNQQSQSATETLQTLSNLLDKYKQQVSEGNWGEAGKTMDKIEKLLK